MLTSEMLGVLEETFVTHHGYYLDGGTGLLTTLDALGADQASWHHPGLHHTIAAHAFHITFYLRTLRGYIDGSITCKTDWAGSWVVNVVAAAEWDAIRADLRREFEDLMAATKERSDWGDEDFVSGTLAILAHTAYHLGAIRQMVAVNAARR